MTRRLLGYVVKLPDGTRSPRTPKPVELYLAEHAWCATDDDAGDYVVPVFATRKPKPAPAEGAADARYACWQGCCMWLTPEDDDPRDTGTRAEAEAVVARIPGAKLVRILDDGAHEAGVEAARREERERVLGLVAAERERVRGRTSDGYLYALDWFEEAAKGQAK